MNVKELSNQDLLKAYSGKRGNVSSEMCRRAGTIKYLLKYCSNDDKKFYSCMKDTIEVFSDCLLKGDRKYAKYSFHS